MDGLEAFHFNDFLQRRLSRARAEFMAAAHDLEDYETAYGSLVYGGEWEEQDQLLSDRAHQTYLAYKEAWVKWYAAANGYNIHSLRLQKDTPAYAASVPTNLLIDRLRSVSQF